MKKSIVSIGVLCILFVALFVFLSSCHGAGAYEEKSFSVDQEFSILIIDADTENISFVVSNNEKCSVVSIERERVYHTVTNEGGKLTVKTVDDRRWYEKFGISYDNRITVYLPRSISTSVIINADTGNVEIPEDFTFEHIDINIDTGNVICNASATTFISIESDTGNILMKNNSAEKVELETETGNISASGARCDYLSAKTETGDILASDIICTDELRASVDTGKTVLSNITCKSFVSTGDTGRIQLSSVIVEEKMAIKRNSGDVRFDKCDAGEVEIITDTGDVKGSFLTEKIIFAETDTGRVDVPKLTSGARCDITTDTGDIKITIEQ